MSVKLPTRPHPVSIYSLLHAPSSRANSSKSLAIDVGIVEGMHGGGAGPLGGTSIALLCCTNCPSRLPAPIWPQQLNKSRKGTSRVNGGLVPSMAARQGAECICRCFHHIRRRVRSGTQRNGMAIATWISAWLQARLRSTPATLCKSAEDSGLSSCTRIGMAIASSF
jgi:hypothetical protein